MYKCLVSKYLYTHRQSMDECVCLFVCLYCVFLSLFVVPGVYSKEGEYPISSTTLWKVLELRIWWKVCASLLLYQEYIVERESIPLVPQPCEKYLSWEDGEKYVLVCLLYQEYIVERESKLLVAQPYEKYVCTWVEKIVKSICLSVCCTLSLLLIASTTFSGF